MAEKQVIIYHEGSFKFETIEKLLTETKQNLTEKDISIKAKKRVLNIMVECLENIYKHAEKVINNNHFNKEEYNKFYKFVLENKEQDYLITAANPILNKNIETVKNKIEQANSLSKPELKELYASKINNSMISERGGAGLGIIDIALKSENKIDYSFTKIDDLFSYYELKIKINDNK
jgi:hypothetical protein